MERAVLRTLAMVLGGGGGPTSKGGSSREICLARQEPERRLKEQTSEAVPPKILAVVRGTWVSCAWAEVYFLFGAREAG